MFDTVRASVDDLVLNPDRLMQKGWKKAVTTAIDGEGVVDESVRYVLMERDAHPHFLMYLPKSGTLKFESSLPKVLHSENVSLLRADEVDSTLDRISNFISDRCGDVPAAGDFNVRGRLDAVYSWDTRVDDKDMTAFYLHALRNTVIARHTTQAVDREATLYWFNGSRRVRMYDKFRESKLELAKGQLRFEVQLNHAKSEIEKLGHIGGMQLRNVLNWDTSKRVLAASLNEIAGGLVIASEERVFLDLLRQFKPSKAVRLYGYLQVQKRFAPRDLERLGMKRWSVWHNRKEIADACIAGFTENEGPSVLPALRLPEHYDGQPGRLV